MSSRLLSFIWEEIHWGELLPSKIARIFTTNIIFETPGCFMGIKYVSGSKLSFMEPLNYQNVQYKLKKATFFCRHQLFSIKTFQKPTTSTVPNLELPLTIGNILAQRSRLQSSNASFSHSSYNHLNSSAFAE